MKRLFLSRMLRHSCCEVRVMQLHDILQLRTSVILPEAISDGGLAPTTDTSLFLTTYRGGSHLPSDISFAYLIRLRTYRKSNFLIIWITGISFVAIQVERTWDLVRDSGQRKLTYSSQNHCTSPRSVYLSRRLYSHWERLVITHHLQKWESSRLR